MLLTVASALAIPASKTTFIVTQPDGKTLSIRLQGDEYRHWNTTVDGYAIVKNSKGHYVYAQKENGRLSATDLLAHEAADRNAQEKAFVELTGKLVPDMTNFMKNMQQQDAMSRQKMQNAMKARRYDYDNFKGLVILVEYNDCPFKYDNYHEIMDSMINQDNYLGDEYTNCKDAWTGEQYNCVGSMRDYFRDNSNGMFVPHFDVVGPVQIDYSMYYDIESDSEVEQAMYLYDHLVSACTAIDDEVDFSQYDVNHDGVVDMIYFVFSGLPSNVSGNNENLLWPHQSDMSYARAYKDGVRLARYACSTELYGSEAYHFSELDGIGTMCHEFSHVLGLPDFYDTDYEKNGQSSDPGLWSVMASGIYEYGRRPCGYSLFERYALGFATPEVLTEPGHYDLTDISLSNSGYRINTPEPKEYFMLENRQRIKWDAKLPGHGMLVFRVDSTDASVWYNNDLNCNPKHNYYELVRAYGYMGQDFGSDPFPGIYDVKILDNESSPANLITWGGEYPSVGLQNISEQDSIVSFDVFDANKLAGISIPEQLMLGVGTSLQLTPVCRPSYASGTFVWTSDNEAVVTVSSDGLLMGISAGEAHVTLTANDELTAVATVLVKEYPLVENIAAMRQQEAGYEALLVIRDAQVLAVNDKDIYVRDETGSLILRNMGLSVSAGMMLNGSIYGSFSQENNMPVLAAVDAKTDVNSVVVSAGADPKPTELHISQLTDGRYADLVTVTKVQLEKKSNGVFAVLGDRQVRLYNTLKIKNIKVPTDYSKRYDITAIYGTNLLNGELIDELYLMKSPVAVDYTMLKTIELPDASFRLNVGRTRQLSAVLTPSDADVFLEWISSNTEVATVSSDGVVTAIANGAADIVVTNLDNGLSATCHVVVGETSVAQDIAAFKQQNAKEEAELLLKNAQVVYVNKQDAYVRDASGAICFSAPDLALNVGDQLNGQVYGLYDIVEDIPYFLQVKGITSPDDLMVTSGGEVLPREVTLEQLSEADYADLVAFKGAQMTTVEGLTGLYVSDGNKHVRIYNDFRVKNLIVPKEYENHYYNLTGILLSATVEGQHVFNLALITSPEEVEIVNGISDSMMGDKERVLVFTSDGRLLRECTADAFAHLSLPSGVYLLKTASRVIKVVKK